jgi:hypothetical protein
MVPRRTHRRIIHERLDAPNPHDPLDARRRFDLLRRVETRETQSRETLGLVVRDP